MSRQRKSTMAAVHAKPIQQKHAAGIDIGATGCVERWAHLRRNAYASLQRDE
jgi:hypothetical protein